MNEDEAKKELEYFGRGIEFDPIDHVYYIHGVETISVTQLIRFLRVDELKADDASARFYMDRGTRVHEACTEFDFFGDNAEIDADIAPYIKAYSEFKRDYQVKDWKLFEFPDYTDVFGMKVAGTVDRAGKVGGVNTIVEIKTGVNRPLLYGTQLHAYNRILSSNHRFYADKTAVLQLKGDGTYTYRVLCDTIVYDDALFGCVTLEKAKKEIKKWK